MILKIIQLLPQVIDEKQRTSERLSHLPGVIQLTLAECQLCSLAAKAIWSPRPDSSKPDSQLHKGHLIQSFN